MMDTVNPAWIWVGRAREAADYAQSYQLFVKYPELVCLIAPEFLEDVAEGMRAIWSSEQAPESMFERADTLHNEMREACGRADDVPLEIVCYLARRVIALNMGAAGLVESQFEDQTRRLSRRGA